MVAISKQTYKKEQANKKSCFFIIMQHIPSDKSVVSQTM